jgi:hypothetical protein
VEIRTMTRTPAVRFPRSILSLVVLGLLVAGCAKSGPMTWKKSQSPELGTAQADGYYELTTGDQTIARYQVQAGEPLGFRTGSDGRVQAVAGIYSVPLNSTKTYSWRTAK